MKKTDEETIVKYVIDIITTTAQNDIAKRNEIVKELKQEPEVIINGATQLLTQMILEKKKQSLETENMRRRCYTCIYRGDIPGDTHSCCHNLRANVIGDEHGCKNGWFFHPFNFDPTWLLFCDGYEEKEGK